MFNSLKIFLISLLFLNLMFFSVINAQSDQTVNSGNSADFNHLHTVYDSLLKNYVENGKVDYKGFISSTDQFNQYLDQLGSVRQKDLESWSREERLAYWINAYNAFTVKAITDNYPIERNLDFSALIYPKNSIRQIDGVWDKLKFRAGGRQVTLNEIEHEILRKKFNEPRIHTAIVCASIGCPDLKDEAYRAGKIDKQLESSSFAFVNNSEKGVRIDTGEKEVHLSRIFKWFGKDFVDKYGTNEFFNGRDKKQRAVLNFVRKYIKSKEKRKFLENNDFSISYIDYDWSLNEKKDNNGE